MARRVTKKTESKTVNTEDTAAEATKATEATEGDNKGASENSEVIDSLIQSALSIKKKIEGAKAVMQAAAEQRDNWITFGQVLADLRAVIPSNNKFNSYLKDKGLDEIGGHRNNRSAAMWLAGQSSEMQKFLAERFPETYHPKTLQQKHRAIQTEFFDYVMSLGDDADAEMAVERDDETGKVSKVTTFSVSEADLAEQPHLWQFYNAASADAMRVDFAAYLNRAKPVKYEDKDVKDAAADVLNLIARHPQKDDVFEAVVEMVEKGALDATESEDDAAEGEDESEGETEAA